MESSTSRGDSQVKIPDDVESMDCNDDGQAPIQGQAGEKKSDGQAGGIKSDDQAGGQRPDGQAGGQRPVDAALWAQIPDVTEQPRTSMSHQFVLSNTILSTRLDIDVDPRARQQQDEVRVEVTAIKERLPQDGTETIKPKKP